MIEAAEHHEVAALALLEPLMDAGDGAGAETGFFFDCGIGNALPQHAGDLPPFGQLADFCLREQVAEELAALLEAFEPIDGRVQVVDISRSYVFHTLPK